MSPPDMRPVTPATTTPTTTRPVPIILVNFFTVFARLRFFQAPQSLLLDVLNNQITSLCLQQ